MYGIPAVPQVLAAEVALAHEQSCTLLPYSISHCCSKFSPSLSHHALPSTCLSTNSGISSSNNSSRSTPLNLPSSALVQCAMIRTTSSTKTWSGVIFAYQLKTNSLITIAMMAYSCKSISLLLVSGGRISEMGRGMLRSPVL